MDEYEVATTSTASSIRARLETKFEVLAPKAPRSTRGDNPVGGVSDGPGQERRSSGRGRGRGGRGRGNGGGRGQGSVRTEPFLWQCICPNHDQPPGACTCNVLANGQYAFTETPSNDGRFLPFRPDPRKCNSVHCTGCGELGHIVRYCTERDSAKAAQKKSANDAKYATTRSRVPTSAARPGVQAVQPVFSGTPYSQAANYWAPPSPQQIPQLAMGQQPSMGMGSLQLGPRTVAAPPPGWGVVDGGSALNGWGAPIAQAERADAASAPPKAGGVTAKEYSMVDSNGRTWKSQV